ncbi:hypothetical protein SVEN_1028 [Streptomyces venezuelae ATCC 10712]|uniref:Uncharacterized protein n=1 Tax=Streptomyces venezuelae (strain ATCC 10712 / CBS 650.69 / DSM 40230 / JCM 4526 / NBRC 13096 / PD 04745) TaxID=953739 RepID=F2RCF7_STRVP|nr:hypothetical protein SVEN_1028 [Streptomyces venezuelae ATCC 10712]
MGPGVPSSYRCDSFVPHHVLPHLPLQSVSEVRAFWARGAVHRTRRSDR